LDPDLPTPAILLEHGSKVLPVKAPHRQHPGDVPICKIVFGADVPELEGRSVVSPDCAIDFQTILT
jgi:hypothetical protein